MIHQLKCLPKYFEDIAVGKKTFEVRKNDRNFYEGDYLALNEITPHEINFEGDRCETGRSMLLRVTYVLNDVDYCKAGQAILGFCPCAILPSNTPFIYTENKEVMP